MSSATGIEEQQSRHEHQMSCIMDESTTSALVVPSSGSTDENEEMVITTIRATNVALGLRRLPAGFYTVIHHNGFKWRTENMPSSVDDDVVQWNGPISIPLNLSLTVRLEVYASFEFQPMLGTGEQLRELTVTMEQLLDFSAREVPFIFLEDDGDVVSPCSSIVVTVQRWKSEKNLSALSIPGPHYATTQAQSTMEDITNRGHTALSRYQNYGNKRDLERSIEDFELALRVCSLDHPCRAAAQCNLAMVKLILCQVECTDASLEVPLRLYRNALTTRPVGHPDRPSTLINLAAVHFARLRFRNQRDDVGSAEAEVLLNEAMELSPTGSHEKRTATFMHRLYTRHSAGHVQPSGQSSMEKNSNMNKGITDEDIQVFLCVEQLKRYERFGDLADLQQAIAMLEKLVSVPSVWDDWYRMGLGNLGLALLQRFRHAGELSDLEDSIARQKEAVDLTPHDHPDKPACLSNLGTAFLARFQRFGQLRNLEDAISSQRDAVDLTPHGHPHRPTRLDNLGNSFFARFERLGRLSDLEDAISKQRDAVDLTPHHHPNAPGRLNNLGRSLRARFERLGEPSDLEEAISSLRDAVNLAPHGHPNKSVCLNNLGNCFVARFERLGQLSDLDDAISTLKDAVSLTPHGHCDKHAHLSNLGDSFRARFQRLGQLTDLENAISTLRDAIDFTPEGHSDKPACLNNLGNSLRARFQRLGELSDLEDAISTLRSAVELTPPDHPDKHSPLNNLGTSLISRFERLGQLADLEEAISRQRDALDLTPHDHPSRPAYLGNLGTSYRARFQRLDQLSDLEDAISILRNATALTPHGDLDKPRWLNDLGISFFTRFQRLGQLSDLEEAISKHRDSVDLTPHGHPRKPAYLSGLGTSLRARFERLGQLSDLNEAILRQREAVDLTSQDHPDKPSHLNNLGSCCRIRFERLGELRDLEDSILWQSNALDLTPLGHTHKPVRLNNLANSFFTRFQHLGELTDLEEAISRMRAAIDLTPHGYPAKSSRLKNLGTFFETHFELVGEPSSLEQAISLYSHAALVPVGPISIRFLATQSWISCARRISHHSLLHAYSVALDLLPQLAWIGLSLTHRYDELTRGTDIVREAAAAALNLGFPETAVEWLEQGRSIVWGELLQLRSSYEELSSAHPAHARRLRDLSAALDQASATHEKSLSQHSEQNRRAVHHATEFSQQEADRHRALAIERDKLLQEIRRLPGFEQFLLRKRFSRLRASAHSGPVVILNAAESRCDALIVLADVDHVIHVPLPNFTFRRSAGLQNALERLLGHARVIQCDERKGDPSARGSVSWEPLLSSLWTGVVKPVLDAMAFPTPGDLSRIFWCPTGPFVFLPIHAAGFYDGPHTQPGHKVSDFVVSSYVPTLSILTLSSNPRTSFSSDLRFLAVRQPPSDGLFQLPGVDTELKHIEDVVKNSPSARIDLIESPDGTVEQVLDLMREADWVHFACHGIQDRADSGLCLADKRRLKLRDIVALSRPHGGLAFLSACQTAMGDENLSDEAIHIAAGMLFAGYGGVVGTMWSISDRVAPDVARDVYAQLFGNGTRPDHREAAQALHRATGRLRERNASFVEWVPFIHVGL